MAEAAANPSNTREKILDAAETLFIEHGYAGTSLRAVAQRAKVNLAATHYHFGSKKGLFAAVFHRRAAPVSRARLAALDALEADHQVPTVRMIIKAFLNPLYSDPNDEVIAVLPNLVGRVYGEPDSLSKPMLETEFTEVARRYQAALARAMTDVSDEELHWRFHFMIGSMIQLLRFNSPMGVSSAPEEFIEGLERLVDFVTAGLEQGAGVNAGRHKFKTGISC